MGVVLFLVVEKLERMCKTANTMTPEQRNYCIASHRYLESYVRAYAGTVVGEIEKAISEIKQWRDDFEAEMFLDVENEKVVEKEEVAVDKDGAKKEVVEKEVFDERDAIRKNLAKRIGHMGSRVKRMKVVNDGTVNIGGIIAKHKKQGGRCVSCECSISLLGNDTVIDFCIPFDEGGEFSIDNLFLSCQSCANAY